MMLVGIDGGNNTIITAVEGMEPIIIPTLYAPFKDYDQGLETSRKNLRDSLDVEIELNFQNAKTKKNLGRFYVGTLAKQIEGSNVKIRNIGKDKQGDESLMFCMLTSLAVTVVEEQNKFEGTVTQDIKMVTGLPLSQYKNSKSQYAKELIGSHKVTFRGNYNIDVELHITDVEVEVEGAGALNKLIFDESGNYIYPENDLVDRIILGIEVGEFTSEIIAITFLENNDGKVLPEFKIKLCTPIDKGIANAKQPIIDLLRENHNTIKDRYDIDTALKRVKNKGIIYLENGEPFNIINMYEEQLKSLAEDISIKISDKIKSSGEKGNIMHTLIFGGGPCVLDYKFGNFLRDRIKEIIGGNSEITNKPHLENSLGYLEKAKVIYGAE